MQKNSQKQTLNYLVIVDSHLNINELKKANKDQDWLDKYLKENHKKIEDISLLCIDKKDKITMYSKKFK